MKKPSIIRCAILLFAIPLTVRAEATALTSIDWAGMTYVTTGNLGVSWNRIGGGSMLQTPYTSDWNDDAFRSFSQPGQHMTVINSPLAQSVEMSSSNGQGLIGQAWKHVDVKLEGTGTVEFHVPYDFQLAQQGDYQIKAWAYAYIDQMPLDGLVVQAFLSAHPYQNTGTPSSSGEFILSLTGYGPETHYQMSSSVFAQFNPIPEPESYALLGLGLGSVWMRRRRLHA